MAKRLLATAAFVAAVALLYFLPLRSAQPANPLLEGVRASQIFIQQNLLYALLPALALAAVVSVSIDKQRVVRAMSDSANRSAAYILAAGSGGVLSACSCSVLPLFAGIRRMGAGLGPAIAFLYAGPAVNILATVITARMLGWEIGLARGVAAIGLGIVIGALMSRLFQRTEQPAIAPAAGQSIDAPPLRRVIALVAAMLAVIVFLTWSPSGFVGVMRCCPGGKTSSEIQGEYLGQTDTSLVYRDHTGETKIVDRSLVAGQIDSPLNHRIYEHRYALAGVAVLGMLGMMARWFTREDAKRWLTEAYFLGRKIAPLFLLGVFLSGMLLGRPGRAGVVPSEWVTYAVGGNSIGANLAAAALGAFMYFATLNEVPVIQGLINGGMGRGPALSMLLAGPAVPGLLVLSSLMGWRKTLTYTSLVILAATMAGTVFGAFLP